MGHGIYPCFELLYICHRCFIFIFIDSERLFRWLGIFGWSSSAFSWPLCLFLCLYHVQVSFCFIWPLLSAGMKRWHYNLANCFSRYRKCTLHTPLENDFIRILKIQMEPMGSGFLEWQSSVNKYPCSTSQSSTVECQSITLIDISSQSTVNPESINLR